MVEANAAGAARAHLSNPTTKRGFKCPLMMTEGNTHVVYASGTSLVFRGRNGAPDFVYLDHVKKITALGHCQGTEYAFGDEQGVVHTFTFTAEAAFEITKSRPMIAGPIKSIEFIHESKPMQQKMIAIGDGGPAGTQAVALRTGNGMACGEITGAQNGLNCSAHTEAKEQAIKSKLFTGGESGELFMHEGAPFPGQGQVMEHFHGDYINDMVLNDETNRLYIVTSSKKIAVYNTETLEKICEKVGAHTKGIYGIALATYGNAADIVTCSADNTVKGWSLNEDTKELKQEYSILQAPKHKEGVTHQLLNLVCFEENSSQHIIAATLGGDLISYENDAAKSLIAAQKDKVDACVTAADDTVYYTSETDVFALRGGVTTRVQRITAQQKMDVLAANDHSVYAATINGSIYKINGDEMSANFSIEGTMWLDFGLDNETIYAIAGNRLLCALDANTLAVKCQNWLEYDPKCVTLVKVADEVWVGDKKTGKIHVHDIRNLNEKEEDSFDAHGQYAVDCLTTSKDGTMVASGDHNRRIKVWGATTKAEEHEYGHHKNFVADACFTQDGSGIASVSDDHFLVVYNCATKKHFAVPRIHGDKRVNSVTVTADKTIFTVGDDCQVREWPASETWDKIPA